MTQSFHYPRRAIILHRARLSVAVLLAFGLSGCNYRFGVPEPITEQGKEVLTLWQVSLYAAVALGVLVIAILLYSIIRHRRRDNVLPKQTEGHVPLELTYTVIPFIIVVLLFFYGLKVQDTTTELTGANEPQAQEMLNLEITGYQWNWRFHYPEENVTLEPDATGVLNELVLPVDRRVRFNLVAIDVAHSFFVPGFLTKRDLIPGVRNEIELTPNKAGTYLGYCAEYCGLYHAEMNFKVRVVPQAEYDTWVQAKKASSAPSAATDPGRPVNNAPIDQGKGQVAPS